MPQKSKRVIIVCIGIICLLSFMIGIFRAGMYYGINSNLTAIFVANRPALYFDATKLIYEQTKQLCAENGGVREMQFKPEFIDVTCNDLTVKQY